MSRARRVLGLLATIGPLVACRAGPAATAAPERPREAPIASAAEPHRPAIVADRGVAHSSEEVRVVASWRSDVDPRGVVVVFFAEEPGAAGLANRILDAGFNHAFVEPAHRPLATRLAVAAALTNDKSLGQRQRMEQGHPRRPGITVFWLDGRGGGALEALRAAPPFRVQAAIVLTRAGPPRRHVFAGASGGELHVLEIVSPIDDAAWTEVVRFLDEIERRQASMPLRSLMAPPRPISMQSRTKWRASASFPGERAPAGVGVQRDQVGVGAEGVSEQLRVAGGAGVLEVHEGVVELALGGVEGGQTEL